MLTDNPMKSQLTWEQVDYFINNLSQQPENYRMLMPIILSSYFGLKYVEIKHITCYDVFIVRKLRTRHQNIIPITNPNIINIFNKMSEVYESTFVMSNNFGGIMSIQYINRQLKRLLIEHKLPYKNVTLNTFRKAFGHRILELNSYRILETLSKLQEIYGQTSIRHVKMYLDLPETPNLQPLKLYESL